MMETLSDHISAAPFGGELRYWRKLRGITQMELAMKASTTPRHVSFMETGRSRPSGKMVMRLAEALNVPASDRNEMLSSAGFEPMYQGQKINEIDQASFDRALAYILKSHEPYPAIVVNRWYDIIDVNRAAQGLFLKDGEQQLGNVINRVFQMSSYRDMVLNWSECAWSVLHELRRSVMVTPKDSRLLELLRIAEASTAKNSLGLSSEDTEHISYPIYTVGNRRIATILTTTDFQNIDPGCADKLRVMTFFPRDPEAELFFAESAD
jgi:transcriptional regulator with XRE-family HTH domain